MPTKDKWDGYVPTPKLRKAGLLPSLKGEGARLAPTPKQAAGGRSRNHPRLFGRFDETGGPKACWPWLGARDRDGYGIVRGQVRAHRLAWEWAHNAKAEGLVIRHTCDNPACCNPRHLVSGSHADNVADQVARGRTARGSRNGRSALAEFAVIAIFLSQKPTRDLAAAYNVDESSIRAIKTGRTWGWLTSAYSKDAIRIPKNLRRV